ncbi:hypothetical protein AYL25_14145 [Enterobacter roggenkampii]|nr:hypothetical protein AYL25_14145 [Enterobacter roggenkampii]
MMFFRIDREPPFLLDCIGKKSIKVNITKLFTYEGIELSVLYDEMGLNVILHTEANILQKINYVQNILNTLI